MELWFREHIVAHCKEYYLRNGKPLPVMPASAFIHEKMYGGRGPFSGEYADVTECVLHGKN
jgi:hypothetical protein